MFQQTKADLNGFQSRDIEIPVTTNHTETEWLEILAELVPRPEQIYESQNGSEPQPGKNCYCRYFLQIFGVSHLTEFYIKINLILWRSNLFELISYLLKC
jgi:hypothetical protein